MIKWISSLFSKNGQAGSGSKAKLKFEPGGLEAMGEIPRYPPFHEGLPNATPKQLLATQARLLRQIKHELALPESDYNALVPPLLEGFAAYVHLLPASKSHHHRGAGGMLRHGLEVGLIATKRFHAKIIDGHETGQRRKVLEPRWRLAVFIAGITHDIGKSAYDVTVTDISGHKKWDVYTQTLHEFLVSNKLDRYFVGWRKNREHKVHEKFSHLLTMKVVPAHVFSWLNDGDPRIISAIHETISGHQPKGSARVMYDLVMQADQASVSEDVKGQKIAEGEDSVAVPVPKYLLDAMKRLIESNHWRANQEGQPLWVTKQGVFLDWDKAVKDIVDLLEKDGSRGIPKSKSSIAESLADFDLIKMHDDSEGNQTYYRKVAPEPLERHGVDLTVLTVVEVNGEGVLFDDIAPAKVSVAVDEGGIAARKKELEEAQKASKEERKKKPSALKEKLVKQGADIPVLETAEEPPQDPADQQPGTTESESESDNQPEEIPAKAPHKASEAPDAWLDAYGEKGEILRECFIPRPDSAALFVGDEILLPYPAGMEIYGENKAEKLALITDLLKKDSMLSAKAVQKRKVGKKTLSVLVINGELAQKLAELGSLSAPDNKSKPERSEAAEKPEPTPQREAEPKQAPAAKVNPKPEQSSPQVDQEAEESTPESAVTNTPDVSEGKGDPEKEPKPEPKKPPEKKPAARAKSGQKPAAKPRKKAAKKDVPPPAPAARSEGRQKDAQLVEMVMKSYQKAAPNIKTLDDDGGSWVHQNELLSWYQESGEASESYLTLISVIRRAEVNTKSVDKETYVFIPDNEV